METYPEISLWLSIAFVLGGFAVLAWSANAFVDGASALAKAFGVSPFIIGMIVIGFGTSAPELCVSALSGATGHSDLSLGNAYGSCIFNSAVILGVAALIKPLLVKPSVVFVAVPMLVAIAILSWLLVTLGDGFSRVDGIVLLAVFAVRVHDGVQAPVQAVLALGVGDAAHIGIGALGVALPGGFRGLEVKEEFVLLRFLFCHRKSRPFHYLFACFHSMPLDGACQAVSISSCKAGKNGVC